MISEKGLWSVEDLDAGSVFSFFDRLPAQLQTARSIDLMGVLAFFEDSTRTRISFEKAGLDLGVRWTQLSPERSSLNKGESLEDSFEVLGMYNFDFYVLRHPEIGSPQKVWELTKKPVLNAGDGYGEHPTQALGDAYSLWLKSKEKPLKVLFYGDYQKNRVARSCSQLFKKLGHDVAVVDHGPGVDAAWAKERGFPVVSPARLKDFDVIYSLRTQKERGGVSGLPSLSKKDFRSGQLLMNAGPVIWGQELEPELKTALGEDSLILTQLQSCFQVRKALLLELQK